MERTLRNRKFATPAIGSLPRSADLTARRSVDVPAEREGDDTKVAVIWGLTGQSAQWLDTGGELVIADAPDLRAYDMAGKEIPASDGRLVLPLSPNPVYVSSERLDVLTLRDRIQGGLIRRLTPRGIKHVTALVYTAYDENFVYLGAAVHEENLHCSAGQPFTSSWSNLTPTLPYLQGVPDGLQYITECGNVLQFSFGFRDRVPSIGRQIDEPWAWKGSFYDTDYSYHKSAKGDQLIRIWGPDTARRNGYQTESVPGIGPVPGGQVKVTRDDVNNILLDPS